MCVNLGRVGALRVSPAEGREVYNDSHILGDDVECFVAL